MKAEKIIYLIRHDGEVVWCEDPAPETSMNPDEAIKYIRADELLPLLRDCESYAHAQAVFNHSGEGAQLATRCRALISIMEAKS